MPGMCCRTLVTKSLSPVISIGVDDSVLWCGVNVQLGSFVVDCSMVSVNRWSVLGQDVDSIKIVFKKIFGSRET